MSIRRILSGLLLGCLLATGARAADRLFTIHSARVMSQSMPWIAQAAGIFDKYGIDHRLVFIASSTVVTAAILSGDAEMTLTGGIGNVRAYIQGATDLVFVGGVKNVMTQSILAGGNIRRPEDIRGKQIGVSRIGSNTHYFTVQALRRYGMDPGKDFSFIQTGGDPESLAALLSKRIEVATLTAPSDAKALAEGYRYVVYGPDLKIPYAATAFVTKRSVIARKRDVIARFMRAMAESARILHTDREFVYKVLGKQLRLTDRTILDAAYNAEIKALEPRLVLKPEALQAILDEVTATDARAKNVRPQEMIDNSFVNEMEKSGFFDQLWAKK
ncbi:MAG TPA: ABC transporter substrate-binding protein [candidate division Zixibacteria bacterium]|nr:ABC transporter substrate-binding protein [candidate division Zixibacteria bacterium]